MPPKKAKKKRAKKKAKKQASRAQFTTQHTFRCEKDLITRLKEAAEHERPEHWMGRYSVDILIRRAIHHELEELGF